MNIPSRITNVLLALSALAAVITVSSDATASTYSCAYYNPVVPGQCMSWEPGLLPTAAW